MSAEALTREELMADLPEDLAAIVGDLPDVPSKPHLHLLRRQYAVNAEPVDQVHRLAAWGPSGITQSPGTMEATRRAVAAAKSTAHADVATAIRAWTQTPLLVKPEGKGGGRVHPGDNLVIWSALDRLTPEEQAEQLRYYIALGELSAGQLAVRLIDIKADNGNSSADVGSNMTVLAEPGGRTIYQETLNGHESYFGPGPVADLYLEQFDQFHQLALSPEETRQAFEVRLGELGLTS